MLKINSVTELKNAFDMLINRMDLTNKRISELEDTSVATFKTKKKREQRLKNNRADYLRTVDNYRKCNQCAVGIPVGEEREK